MPEEPSFRERQMEACRTNLLSRREAIDVLHTAINQINEVEKVKYPLAADITALNPKLARLADALGELFGNSKARLYNSDTQRPDWTQSPRLIMTNFIHGVIKIIENESPEQMLAAYDKCRAEFKKTYPHASGNISEIARLFEIRTIVIEVAFVERLEEANSLSLFLSARINTGLKARLAATTE